MKTWNRQKYAAIFLLPYGVLFLVFVVSPVIYGFIISLLQHV